MVKGVNMINKMSFNGILKGHFSSLSFKDKATFLWIPLIIAVIFSFFASKLDVSIINILLVSLSIFVGFLFNLLVLSISIKDDNKRFEVGGKTYTINHFLKEFNNNISFGILLAIITIIILLIYAIFSPTQNVVLYNIFTFLFLIWFFMTLFMLLKRGHLLFSYYLKDN